MKNSLYKINKGGLREHHKNRLKQVTFVMLFLSLICILSFSAVSAADYDDIRNQVNSANSGDTINLGSDTYTSDGSYVGISGKNLTIRGSSNSNRATLNGGDQSAAFIIDSGSTVTFRYINFVGASSSGFSAIRANGTIIIENCTFSSCNGDSGAAIYLREDSYGSRIVNTRFIDNKADNDGDNDYTAGGAICVNGADNVEIRNCYFSGNTALNAGGALTLRDDATNTKIINCEFVNNRAPNGGAIYNQLSTGTVISDCTFTNNQATTGGAICSINVISITSSTFNKNTAKNYGGGVYTSGTGRSTITGSKFTGNSAKNGGGIYNNALLSISSSTFTSNKASNHGGAIYSKNGLNISKSTISKNSANYGSGVYSSNILRVDSSTLSSNSAKFIKMMISAPNSAKSGSNVAIKAGLVYGDNVAGAFYTTNGNVYINGKKSTVSSYSPNKKITLKFNGKSVSAKSNSNGIATFNVVVSKISKTTTYKATVSSTQGSKTFSTSKNIKFTVNTKTNSNSKNSNKSSSTVKIKNTASSTNNGVIVSKVTITLSEKYKQVLKISKKSKIWKKTKDSNDNYKYPDKKFRWVTVKYSITTTKYTNIPKNHKFPKGAKVKYSNNKKDATVTLKKTISTKAQNIVNPYLSSSYGCNINDPFIKKLAKKLIKGKKSKKAQADAILIYVQRKINYKGYGETRYGARKTLNNKRGNCVDSSHLTVALLRAAGIPARYERKMGWNNKEHTVTTGHVWPQAYVYYKGKYRWMKGDAVLDNEAVRFGGSIKKFFYFDWHNDKSIGKNTHVISYYWPPEQAPKQYSKYVRFY